MNLLLAAIAISFPTPAISTMVALKISTDSTNYRFQDLSPVANSSPDLSSSGNWL
ncbi:MAG: hypothetical protein AB4290_21805 [Spirulina sp.]